MGKTQIELPYITETLQIQSHLYEVFHILQYLLLHSMNTKRNKVKG